LLDILNADEYTMYLKNLQKTTDEAFKVAPW